MEDTVVATSGKILDLQPVVDSDNLVAATVVCGQFGKWRGVVNRASAFAPGDMVEVYLPDALLPHEERFAFMESKKWRVRLARLRGALSECLIMPVGEVTTGLEPGVNIMPLVGCAKFVKDNIDPRQALGVFPAFIPKTDETNYQTLIGANGATGLEGLPWVATIKYDGTSTTAYVKASGENAAGELHVCSRSLIVKGGEYWQVANKYGLADKLHLFNGLAPQWETVGPGINKNTAALPDKQARLFNAFDIEARQYVSFKELRRLGQALGMPLTEVVASGNRFDLTDEDLADLLRGLYYPGTKQPVEGIVVRALGRLDWSKTTFKYLNPDYKG